MKRATIALCMAVAIAFSPIAHAQYDDDDQSSYQQNQRYIYRPSPPDPMDTARQYLQHQPTWGTPLPDGQPYIPPPSTTTCRQFYGNIVCN